MKTGGNVLTDDKDWNDPIFGKEIDSWNLYLIFPPLIPCWNR